MRQRLILFGTGLALLLALSFAGAGQTSPERERVAALITQLGSDSFHEREQARTELEAIGPPALAALRAATKTGDLETARRAADLVRLIEERTLTGKLLAPTKLRLQVKDLPVLQAVEKLAKLSGFALRVDGDRTGLLSKTVTLDTGEVTFWEAVDRLGSQAGVVEKLTVASVPGDANQLSDTVAFFGLSRPTGNRLVRRTGPPPVPPLRIMRLPSKDSTATHPKASEEPKADAPPPAAPILAGRVVLTPGSPSRQHVSYAGAARVLLHPVKLPTSVKTAAAAPYYDLMLEASAEPRLLGFTLIGVPTVTRAVDEHGQVLSFVIDPTPETAPRNPVLPPEVLEALNEWQMTPPPTAAAARGVTVRLQHGARPAQRLRELSGSLTAQVLLPNSTLVTLDDVLKAKGKSADIPGGGRLFVEAIDKVAEAAPGGGYRLIVKVESLPSPNGPAIGVIRNGQVLYYNQGPLGDAVPALLDAQGRPLTVVSGPTIQPENSPDGQLLRVVATVVYRTVPGEGEPARLVLTGTAVPTIVVPFRFVNVPLR